VRKIYINIGGGKSNTNNDEEGKKKKKGAYRYMSVVQEGWPNL